MVPFSKMLLYVLVTVHKELFGSSVEFPANSDISAIINTRGRTIVVLIDVEIEIPQDKESENEINSNASSPALFVPSTEGFALNGTLCEGFYFLFTDGFLKSIGDELGNLIFALTENEDAIPAESKIESLVIECLVHELRHEFQFFEESGKLLNLKDLESFCGPQVAKKFVEEWNSLVKLYDNNKEIELDAFIVGIMAKSIWRKKITKRQKMDMIKHYFRINRPLEPENLNEPRFRG